MKSQLDIDVRFRTLLKFVVPSILLMMFLSLYVMVDGVFVARFVGTTALSAINIVYPIINITLAIGLMLGTGGSAICARKLGMDKTQEARQDFTSISLLALFLGLLLLCLGLLFQSEIIYFLGANDSLYEFCRAYLFPTLLFTPALLLQSTFQIFLITAGKPRAALVLTLIAGLTNIVLDYIFIVPLNMGIAGAAWATGLGCLLATIFGLLCFSLSKTSLLKFTKPKIRATVLLQSCLNGSSEMVSNISLAVTNYLFNITMLRLVGEDGVAAITIVLYSQFLLSALYIGYSSGVGPLISYNYGRNNRKNLQRLFRFSFVFTILSGLSTFALAFIFASFLSSVFSTPGTAVNIMATDGLRLFALSFLVAGVNIFSSALFTAFSNGLISALLSFLRTFGFLVLYLLIFPHLFGVTGVFLAVPIAEFSSFLFSLFFLKRYRSVYHY